MTIYKFDEKAISNAIEAAKSTHEESKLNATDSVAHAHVSGCMQVNAECISVTVENQKVCINLPLGIGKYCFSIPLSIPEGSVGSACLSICTTWGFPTGLRVTITIAGIVIIDQTFLKC